MKDRQEQIAILTGFGGSHWQKYGKDRVYFDAAAIASRQGLDWSNYKTGNISSARLNGEKISNSEARRILDEFQWFKIWFDLDDGQFHTRSEAYKTEIQYATSRQMYGEFVADAMAAIGQEV